jgi:hypothetical protein
MNSLKNRRDQQDSRKREVTNKKSLGPVGAVIQQVRSRREVDMSSLKRAG